MNSSIFRLLVPTMRAVTPVMRVASKAHAGKIVAPCRSLNFMRGCATKTDPPCISIAELDNDIHFDELKQRLNDVYIIDVRSPEEVKNLGMVPNAVHLEIRTLGHMIILPPEVFRDWVGVEKPRTSQEVVMVCAKGLRARTAQLAFKGAGYTNVRRYRGSFEDWVEKGGPVVGGPPAMEKNNAPL